MSNLENEYQYYLENKDDFIEKHEGKFIVIKGRTVLGIFDDIVTAAEETMKTHELETFIVQEVLQDKDLPYFHSRVKVS